MSKIHLHIEQLSLPGYTPAERRALLAALEKELAAYRGTVGNAAPPQAIHLDKVRVAAADLRPQTVARQAVAGLDMAGRNPGRKGGRT
jgi:hypothetical protein